MPVIFISALMAFAAAVLALLSAAGRLRFLAGAGAGVSAADSDREIFRRQMAEIGRMQGLGLLAEDAAREARLELSRRILAADRLSAGADASACARGAGFRLFLSAAVLFIPIFSGIAYYYLGSPFQPEQSFSAFMKRDPATLNLQEKIVRLEALSARSPDNAGEADALADLYLQAGRFQDAANAYNHALALGGETAPRLLGYALALTGYHDGVVDKDAEAAFRRVLRLDPQNLEAQFFLARGLAQGGKKEQAIALLRQFLKDAPADSPNRKDLQAAIDALEQGDKEPQAGLNSAQRDFVIANLSRLEAKIQAEPQNARAWAMLVNAYSLLGDKAKAAAALSRAMQALPQAQAQALAADAARKGISLPPSGAPRRSDAGSR